MSSTTPPTNLIDFRSKSSTENAVDDERPPSQPSNAEHSQIHDQLTVPMGSYKMAYARRQVGDDDDSSSESDAENDRKGGASDDGDGGDDENSLHLSNYASDEAVSYVESCESFDRFTDSSDEEESDEDNAGGAKEKSSAGGICRRRESNSDSETDDESEEENEKVTSKESHCENEAAKSVGNSNAPSEMNNLTEATKKKSSEKFVGISDDDGAKRRRSTTPVRKLWSDYVYKPDSNQSRGQMRAGARFTNSFTDKRQYEQADQSWSSNHNNRFPPPLGLGLGRGLVPNNDRHHEPNNMRPPGPGGSWQQQRRPNNPYCHYQQQQKYFGMPRGSYASVVQKGPANTGRADSRNTKPTRQSSRSRQGNNNGFSQQSHSKRHNQHQLQQHQPRPAGPGPQRQQQSYNRGTVTAAQILQQQRMQQSQMQQSKRQQQDQQRQGNPANGQMWQPPMGPHVRPLMIGSQQVYVIHPSWNRRPIAEEDPAIVRADPPVPQPYIMLPGGIPLALSMAMRGNPAGHSQTSGSGGMHGVDVNRRAMPVN